MTRLQLSEPGSSHVKSQVLKAANVSLSKIQSALGTLSHHYPDLHNQPVRCKSNTIVSSQRDISIIDLKNRQLWLFLKLIEQIMTLIKDILAGYKQDPRTLNV